MTTADNNSPTPLSGWLWQVAPEVEDDLGADRISVPTALPCPEWCTRPQGHAFEITGPGLVLVGRDHQPGGSLLRVHQQRFGDKPTHVALESFERAATAGGPTDLGMDASATLVRLQFPHACGYLTPDGARRLAALLLRAAETGLRSGDAGDAETGLRARPPAETDTDETGQQQ